MLSIALVLFVPTILWAIYADEDKKIYAIYGLLTTVAISIVIILLYKFIKWILLLVTDPKAAAKQLWEGLIGLIPVGSTTYSPSTNYKADKPEPMTAHKIMIKFLKTESPESPYDYYGNLKK